MGTSRARLSVGTGYAGDSLSLRLAWQTCQDGHYGVLSPLLCFSYANYVMCVPLVLPLAQIYLAYSLQVSCIYKVLFNSESSPKGYFSFLQLRPSL